MAGRSWCRGFPGWVALAAVLWTVVPTGVAGQDASPAPHPVFERLAGSWEGSGELMGRTARFTMAWEVAPGGFVRLRFTNAFMGEGGQLQPVLRAEATYRVTGDAALGVWVDDRPQRITLEAELTDSSITTEWSAATERGRTEYVVRSASEVVVRDFVYVDGVARPFGEAVYRRAAGHAP